MTKIGFLTFSCFSKRTSLFVLPNYFGGHDVFGRFYRHYQASETPRIEPKDVFKWRDCSSNPNVAFLKHFPSNELDPSWLECIHRDFELITEEYAMSTYEV